MAAKNGSYVVDASCLIKWIGLEMEEKEQAEKLRAAYSKREVAITVPALTFWEIGNMLGRKFDPKTASDIFNHFQNYGFRQALLTLEMASLCHWIMKKYPGTSFYDASYHALAIQRESIFITSDKKYYEKTKGLGSILLLKDYR